MSETTTQHPERRAGQRWRHEWDKLEFVLSKPLGLSTTGKEQWESTAGRIWYFGEGELTSLTLIADVPAAAPLAADRCKAPEGYVECVEKCGRWMWPKGGKQCCACFRCEIEHNDGHPDWTPPLAAQPSETKLCTGQCMTNMGTFDRPAWKVCAECGAKVTAQIAAAKAKRQPAPQPEPTKQCCSVSEGGYACACHSLQPAVDLKAAWMAAQSGTPHTGPERLKRPKLAHVAGMHDDDLIGGTR